MGISENVRKNWIATQQKFDHPVNAIGVKIAPGDEKTLKVWRDEGIDIDGRFSGVVAAASASPAKSESKTNMLGAAAATVSGAAKAVMMYRGIAVETEQVAASDKTDKNSDGPTLMYRGVPVE